MSCGAQSRSEERTCSLTQSRPSTYEYDDSSNEMTQWCVDMYQMTNDSEWVDATVIPFPIGLDLWYEFIEAV
jgi:hypothetical protein